MRILKRLLAALLLLVAAALAVLYVADPVITGRLLGMPFGGGAGPVQTVRGGAAAALAAPPAGTSSIAQAALDQAVDYAARNDSHALLVYHDGALQLERYFPGYGADTRTSTQSMHKSVLALAIGIAIRDGFIASVDDPAARYLPEWANDGRAQITIRQLLQQSSGIGFPKLDYANPLGDFMQVMLGGDLERVTLAQPLDGEPGASFDYNNIGPEILGIILERATGTPYAEYLSEALWQRIGATDAIVHLDSDTHRTPRTFCCLDATARSWLQVGLLHLNRGASQGAQVVPEAWMREVVTPSERNPNYGYLTWLGREHQEQRRYNRKSSATAYQSEPYAAADVILFDGFGGQRVYIVPSHGLVIVRTGALALEWDDAVLPNLILRSLDSKL